ncbi:gliding motility-associated C-terminal domain-containing protein [Flagellimonas meridianipacifica]|uniref:Gliding motility-associated-like protein n=1 Tax=Flagellimonas meridianipacifica TaxID=1080225 RepID=A0A2T0MH66_9FLAO|nr:gliding motility-associated C-terminal domain-containing protein [Allomuricauda pacifica]PRX56904.1 gliding motility-associated-like protein [Allomuricauda pacifica]
MRKNNSTYSIPAIIAIVMMCIPLRISAQVLNQPEAAPNPNLGSSFPWTAACASASFNEYFVNFTWNFPLVESNNEFILELSDSNGNFGAPVELARVADKNTDFDFDFEFAVPNDARGENYRLRVRSTNPAKTSPPSVPYPMYFVDFSSALRISEDGNGTLPDGGEIQQCDGGSITLATHNIPNASTYQYNWYRSSTLLSEKSNQLTVSTPGMYYVELDYGSICTGSANTSSNIIEVLTGSSLGVAIAGPSTVDLCVGDPHTLTANLGGSGLTYTWYKDGVVVSGPTVEGNTLNINTSISGFEGNYEVEIEGSGVCTEKSSAITVQNLGSILATRQNDANIVLLPGQDETLSVTTNAVSPTFQWFKDGAPLSGETSSSLTISDIGVYFARVTETAGSCVTAAPVDSESTTVVTPDSFEFTIDFVGTYTECVDSNVTIGITTIDAISNSGARTNVTSALENSFTYQWTYEGNPLSGETSRTLTVTDNSNNGVYALTGVLSSFNANSNSLNVRLATNESLALTSDGNVLCPNGSTITISSSRDLSGESFQWIKDGSSFDTTSTSLTIAESGTYQLSIDTNDCPLISNEITVVPFDESLLVLDRSENIVIIEGETETVTASGAQSYEWFDSNNSLLSSQDSFTFDAEGQYLLTADFGSCTVSRVITVSFRDTFAIPNVITANGDGINDLWVLPNTFSRDPQVLVTIFDERGKEVFSQTNYENNWPESTTSFNQQNMIFYYKLSREGKNLRQGTITVIR